jgi:hypothetical protein
MAKSQTKTRQKRRPKRVFRIIGRFMKFIIFAILFGAIYSVGVTIHENVKVENDLQAFKARAVFDYEDTVDYNGILQTRRYYKVSRETSYEIEDARSVFYNDTRLELGQKGDIFTTQQSPFPMIPAFHLFMTTYYGGHAAINDGQNRFYEATGFPDDDESLLDIMRHPGNEPHDFSVTAARNPRNNWLRPGYRPKSDPSYFAYGQYYRNEFVGLRVKHISEEQLDDVIDFSQDLVDRDTIYNFLFFLDMEYKYYCTDLVSRAYQHVLTPEDEQRQYSEALNDDGFITSVNDLILSDDTYIVFYVEVIDDIVHIYHLEDVVTNGE